MRVRLEDVAKAAGVSPKTVSRVLNNEENVREPTREKVLAAMAAMDYRPHLSARSLASNRSYLVAALYDNPSSNYLTEIQTGVLDACDEHHYSMMVRPLLVEAPDFVQRVDALIAHHRPDGFVLTPPITEHPVLLAHLRERGVPFASVSPVQHASAIGAFIDEPRAAREMVGHLLSLGHRRIAHVIGHPAHGASGWRLAGYREALAAAGLPYDPALVMEGDFSFGSGVAAARALFSLADRPTAVFAANDDMAAGVIWAAGEHGLAVPRDVSVCGFDDTPISRQIWPTLTTIRQPSREMGRIAALQLLASLRGRGEEQMVQLPFALQVRESTAPVA
ncbi:LacI family DNA-binding transcriptional regulator [Dyella sp.]|jgi:LacI family transcriptional regulator|uniref:LacI family DNA-binding transcriptional regulator n=1 Tax=Dyella sp. TaxID=1869338 RepID=UPI002D76835C|nr:LacI family DNA-binding transcriptional regulator [Dyella sp.]HET6432174.1 LacI family DNA-binding transcriptional regulator [Dyella sp.]